MSRVNRYMLLIGVSIDVILFDLLTKNYALNHFLNNPLKFGPVTFSVIYNRGTAFGLGVGIMPILLGVGAVGVVAMTLYLNPARTRIGCIALGLVLGGALGNLGDRLFRSNHGGVVDFIDFHF